MSLARVSVQPVRSTPIVGRYVFRSTMLRVGVQTKACRAPVEMALAPTITEPSPLTAYPLESPPNEPRLSMPPTLVHRNARVPLLPTITDPSKLASLPVELLSPARVPRSCIPPPLIHRKA